MKKNLPLILFYFLLISLNGRTQTSNPASATWMMTSTTLQGSVTTGLVNAPDQKLVGLVMGGPAYNGPKANQRVQYSDGSTTSWPANIKGPIEGHYAQYQISPQAGNNLKVTGISMQLGARSSSSFEADVYYSTDATFATSTAVRETTPEVNNYLPVEDLVTVSATGLDLAVNEGETLYVRIYPWNESASAASGKYLYIYNVQVSGEFKSLPVASSVKWPLMSDVSNVVTGNLIGANPTFSNLTNYGKLSPAAGSGISIYTGSVWPTESAPVEGRYIQFTAKPKSGGRFEADSVSINLAAWATDNLAVSMYYSKTADFIVETGKLLADKVSINSTAFKKVGGAISETVADGETLYVRLYPFNNSGSATGDQWKLVVMNNMFIGGTVSGVTADPPVITTGSVSNVSTTFASIGANISSDGGAVISESGIVYGTSEMPTISSGKVLATVTSGAFTVQLTGLSVGTPYFVRAFATNSAGTTYGSQVSFTTLAALEVPALATSAATNILAITATCGGNVTEWGGSPITARGICWSNSNNTPTLSDAFSNQGLGTGSFSIEMYPLTSNTKYYVRAFATNSTGTAFGDVVSFTTQVKSPDLLIVVARDGSGDYLTVQEAFNAVQNNYTGTTTIQIKPGTYHEKLFLDRAKVNVVLRGEDPLTTILTFDDYAGKDNGSGGTLGTSGSYSVSIEPDDFVAENITFQNTIPNDGTFSNQQAVALRTNGDRQAFYNCRITGYQDTYYAWGGRKVGRIYMKGCYLEGSVDFIFGRDIVIFDNCILHCNRNNSVLTAPNTMSTTKFGFVFFDCTITTDAVDFLGSTISVIYLGRPWQDEPKSAFIHCAEPANLAPVGWTTMTGGLKTVFGEYNCYGDGSATTSRGNQGVIFTSEEASAYSMGNIFAKTSDPGFSFDWMPSFIPTGIDNLVLSNDFILEQNFPNPASSITTINYRIKETSGVKMLIYNTSGVMMQSIINEVKTPGFYSETISVNDLTPGIYFYVLQTDKSSHTKKMIVRK